MFSLKIKCKHHIFRGTTISSNFFKIYTRHAVIIRLIDLLEKSMVDTPVPGKPFVTVLNGPSDILASLRCNVKF